MTTADSNKRIKIFPIEVTIEAPGGPYKGNAFKLSTAGMIMEVFVNTFNTQQTLMLKWVLPVKNLAMEEEALVVKKYSQKNRGKIVYFMELHFKKLKFVNASAIMDLFQSATVTATTAVEKVGVARSTPSTDKKNKP